MFVVIFIVMLNMVVDGNYDFVCFCFFVLNNCGYCKSFVVGVLFFMINVIVMDRYFFLFIYFWYKGLFIERCVNIVLLILCVISVVVVCVFIVLVIMIW